MEEDSSAEESYTGTFDEQIPTTAGIKALKHSPKILNPELFNLTLFCTRIQKTYLREPGSVLRFDSFPVWDALLPVLAERLGLQHILIEKHHPYYEFLPRGGPHVLVNSKDPLPDSEDDDIAHPLESVLLSQISSVHIGHWVDEIRQLPITDLQVSLLKLLMMACRYNLLALPILEIAPHDLPVSTESSIDEPRNHSYRLELRNENYDISIVHDVQFGSDVSASFLTDAIMRYTRSISKVLQTDTYESFFVDRSQWDYARILSKGLKALGWGTLSYVDEPVKGSHGELSGLDLWRVSTQTSRHGQLGPGVVWIGQKPARRMATFRACLLLKDELQNAYADGRLLPEEYRQFALCWGEQVPDVKPGSLVPSKPPTPKTMTSEIQVNAAIISAMVNALRDLMKAGFQSSYAGISLESSDLETAWRSARSLFRDRNLDDTLYKDLRQRSRFTKNNMPSLPVRDDKICSNIVKTIETSNITIITAATGSGKTTQIPQLILDEYISAQHGSLCNIVCTQPRRVSTISVANRVAFERHQPMGREVGYKVRFDARPVRSGRGITYMTSGYLIRLLEADPLGILQSHSHIILDEVHTRDIDTDLLLTAIKNIFEGRVQTKSPVMPKIILMSATINAGFFQSYFKNLEPRIKVSTIDVPGRAFAVEEKRLDHVLDELQESHAQALVAMRENLQLMSYVNEQMQLTTSSESEPCDSEPMADLEDTKTDEAQAISKDLFVPIPLLHLLIVRLLSTTESGDILIFLPGLAEIEGLEQLLLSSPLSQSEFSDSEKNKMFKLHSALYETNFDVFSAVPTGCRRVILATNIAETSITLADVKFVIDTGLSRGSTFDQVTQAGTFGLQWISKAEVMQRRGRAGRTHAGVYYGTYSQAQYDSMADAPTPEILRTSLEHLVLRNASSPAFRLVSHEAGEDDGPDKILAGQALLTGPSPPEKRFIAAAAKQLHNIRALTADGKATPMGNILSRLPMNPAAGKAVLLGLIFKCFDALVVYGALREDFPLMFDPLAVSAVVERRRMLAGPNDDDRWADLQAFFLYDSRRRERNNAAAVELKEALGIRHDAYCEYAQVSKQTFETIEPMLGLPQHDDDDSHWIMPRMYTPLFPTTPRYLNTNSPNADLVKSLALSTIGTRFAAWNHKHWRTHIHSRVLPRPNSVNHGGSRRGILAQRLRRENGDLLAYGQMRIVSKDKYPWLHDTATASPLMAILFAESVSLVEEESTFVINDWVNYRLCSEDDDMDTKRAAKIIWEYRKALDRFLAYAMQMISLNPYRLKKVRDGELSPKDFNVFFGTKENKFRDIVVDSVVKILGIDSKDRAERVEARTIDEEGIAAKSTENNTSQESNASQENNSGQEYQQFLAESKPEAMDGDEVDPATATENDDDDDQEEQVVFKVVEKVKKQLKYVPVPVKPKQDTLRGVRKEELERRLQNMVKDVLTERLQEKKKTVDEL